MYRVLNWFQTQLYHINLYDKKACLRRCEIGRFETRRLVNEDVLKWKEISMEIGFVIQKKRVVGNFLEIFISLNWVRTKKEACWNQDWSKANIQWSNSAADKVWFHSHCKVIYWYTFIKFVQFVLIINEIFW